MYGAENAGYIRYQIGNILLAQTEAIKLGMVDRYVDLCHQAITLCFPKLGKTVDECEKVARDLEEIMRPALQKYAAASRAKDEERVRPELTAACHAMMRRLVHRMSEESLYAYMEKGIRSGRGLALREEDEEEGTTTPV